ncbi:MAG: hypothetical protein ABIS06_00955, partial [Vicinamibacterales bacterium]
HVTRDGGKNWTNVTTGLDGAPKEGTVSMIEASPFDPATAYVVVDNHRLDDRRPYIYKTADYGKSWKALHPTLPEDVYLHSVREDPAKRGQLYLGTERGVMFSTDDGATWKPLQLNLPTVAVHDLVVKGDDLVVGTHGRSVWILDDLQPVREMTDTMAAKDVALLTSPDATRWRRGDGNWASKYGSFANPPRGASIYYYLKEKPKGDLKIEILDTANRVVRTLSSVLRESDKSDDDDDAEDLKKAALSTSEGLHRAEWDLAWEGAKKIRGGKIDTGDPARGPIAAPGPYTVRLTVGGKTQTTPLKVVADPRGTVSQADLDAQLAFALRVRDDISKLSGLVASIRSVKEQLTARAKALEPRKAEPAVGELLKVSDQVIKNIDALEDRMHNPKAEVTYDILAERGGARLYSRLSPLQMWSLEGDGLPTRGMQQVLTDQEKELAQFERETDAFIEKDVFNINALAAKLRLGFVIR